MRCFSKKYYGFTQQQTFGEFSSSLSLRAEGRAVRGFTFIEVILVIGILGIIVGLAIPFYQSFQVSSQLDNTTQEIVQTLRWAQSKAMASESFSPFGVHLENQRFVLFKGNSYISTDPFNEPVDLPGSLSISPAGDVVFAAVVGSTSDIGSFMISTGGNESSTITINEMGVVNVL